MKMGCCLSIIIKKNDKRNPSEERNLRAVGRAAQDVANIMNGGSGTPAETRRKLAEIEAEATAEKTNGGNTYTYSQTASIRMTT